MKRKKRKIYRPEMIIEYTSITQIPMIIFTICKFSVKKMDFIITCGDIKVGILRYLVIPKYKLKRR